MRFSLRAKILGSFALIVLLALGLAVGMSNRLTRQRYDEYSVLMDESRARIMARVLGDWVAELADAAEEGREPSYEHPLFVTPPAERFIPGEDTGRRRDSTGIMGQMMDRMNNDRIVGPEPAGLNSMVVTNLAGNVLLDTAGFGNDFLNPEEHHGVLIRHANREVGYLYLGNMVPGSPLPRELGYLQSAGRMTWIVTGLIFLLAMGLGLILTRHIIVPIKILNNATAKVETGRLDIRVPDRRKDELGDLSRGFNAMTGSLEKADSQRRQLIADSAHELRTPVSLIRARIEMMEEGIYPMDAEGLSALSEESDRLVSLVEELRVLADLESPKTIGKKSEVIPSGIISDVISAVGPAARRTGIEICSDIAEGISPVNADSGQLHRLFANLLNNALRHAESRIQIRVTETDSDRAVLFLVADDGPGIPVEDRERVFDRYYRIDASRSRDSGGSGLGLAICREIARAHGGSISAGSSQELGGAEMAVEIPRD